METQTKKGTPRDVFLHLLTVITLYVSAGSFISLIFKLINTAFPDVVGGSFDFGRSIRYSMASLIIVFPVFVWLSCVLERDIEKDGEKGNLRIRRWLLYFTLFAAGILLIGDLVALVFQFLNGELTVRFVLKVLTILIVAGAIFLYYLSALKRPTKKSALMRLALPGASIVVLAAIVCGFVIAGSPFHARLERLDAERIGHLQTLQSQILYFWQQKSRLPKTLDELKDPISGFIPPTDPDTHAAYEYKTTGTLSFDLCATFDLAIEVSEPGKPVPYREYPGMFGENWEHSVGYYCFSRAIDPELYSIKPKV